MDRPKGYELNVRNTRQTPDIRKRVPENLWPPPRLRVEGEEKRLLQYEQEARIHAVQQTALTLSVWSEKPQKRIESVLQQVMLWMTGKNKHKLSLEEFDGIHAEAILKQH